MEITGAKINEYLIDFFGEALFETEKSLVNYKDSDEYIYIEPFTCASIIAEVVLPYYEAFIENLIKHLKSKDYVIVKNEPIEKTEDIFSKDKIIFKPYIVAIKPRCGYVK